MVKLFLIIIINIIFILGIGGGSLAREIDHPVSYIQQVSPPLKEVNFTADFRIDAPVSGGRGVTYGSFIENVRRRLAQLGERNSHGLPVLPLQEDRPTQWFDIVLRTNQRSIRFRFRVDNVFLVGYRTENPDGRWFEFGSANLDTQLIDGSSFLGFGGGYPALAGVGERGRPGHGRSQINLGQQPLVDAVMTLANSASNDHQRAVALTVVIQMTSESIRSTRITEYLVENYARSDPPSGQVMDLENGWNSVSAWLLRNDADPTYFFPSTLPRPNGMEIWSMADAIRFFGILLYACNYGNRFLQPHTYNIIEVVDQYCGRGQPLVQVISVSINNIDGENPGDLYGTIKITDGFGSDYIYNTRRKNSESVYPRDTALLTGPTRSISAYGSFYIDVALMDKDRDASPDDEVSRGIVSWNAYETSTKTDKYDTISSTEVNGRYGSATVNYVVLSAAVMATVDVTLIDGDGEDPANVYGLIQAGISTGGSGTYWSVLFRKNDGEDINVRPGQLIPLSRSVLAVKLYTFLKVSANLIDRDRDASPDDEIANGSVEFPAQLSGTSQKYIKGRYGSIRVQVIWASP